MSRWAKIGHVNYREKEDIGVTISSEESWILDNVHQEGMSHFIFENCYASVLVFCSAIRNYHKLIGLLQPNLLSYILKARSLKMDLIGLKSTCQHGCVLPGSSREESALLPFSALRSLLHSLLVVSSSILPSRVASSRLPLQFLCCHISLCLWHTCFPFLNTPVIRLSPPRKNLG